MDSNQALIERAFNQFNIDSYVFALNKEFVVAKTQRSVIYLCNQVNSTFKSVQVALKVFYQSRSQLELTIKAHKIFPKLNECEYLVNHYAIGVINNILAVCMDLIEGSTVDYIVKNRILTKNQLKEAMKGFMKAVQHLNIKKIQHNNITCSNLFITNKNKPIIGCIQISDEKASTSNFYEFGWVLIQLFGEYEDADIDQLKKEHIRKKYQNESFPEEFVAIVNDLILYQQISDEDILLKQQEIVVKQFNDLMDKDSSFDSFINKYTKYDEQFKEQSLRISPLNRKAIQNQKSYFINTALVDQRDLIKAEGYFQEGQIMKASQEFYKIINKTKWMDATPIYNLAYLYFQEKDYDEAIKLFKISIQLNPKHSSAYNLIGCTYDEMDQCKKSLKYYKKSIQLAKNSGNFLNNIGIYYFKQMKYKISLKYITSALELEPEDDRIHGNLGMNYLKLKKYKYAKYHLKKQIQINPKTRSGYYSLAILYKIIEKIQKSIYYFKKHSEVNPDSTNAINKIIETFNKQILTEESSLIQFQKAT
ncbi:hypothetical protein ABPG72_004109 [Tetrahymena utriculariae]